MKEIEQFTFPFFDEIKKETKGKHEEGMEEDPLHIQIEETTLTDEQV